MTMKKSILEIASPARRTLAVGLTALFMTGCAKTITSESMVPATYSTTRSHPYSVEVTCEVAPKVSNRRTFNDPVTFSGEEFLSAVKQAMRESRVFRGTAGLGDGDFLLELFVNDMKLPPQGTIKMTAGLTVLWRLTNQKSNHTVLQESIDVNVTKGFSDAVSGNTRAKLALMGAAQENINKGIQLISGLSLASP